MKPTLPASFFLSLFFCLSFSNRSFSQISVQSTNGYSVNINIVPVAIVTTASSCASGYNYNIELNYNVTFSGTNIPKSLPTLQGTITNNLVSHFFKLPKKGGSGSTTSHSNVRRDISDCAFATIATMNLSTINIEIEGDGISARIVSFPIAIILPVKMVSFSAETDQQKVKLNWSTATEINNDFFTIERSTNESQWTEIKKVKGAVNSNDTRNYLVYDESPVNGTSYYRIKQTDLDGTATYSEIRTVRNIITKKYLSIYPIPNTGNTINITGITDYKNQELTVLNAGGNMLFTTTLSTSSVELPSLTTGVYFIRIKNKLSGEATNLRYIKI